MDYLENGNIINSVNFPNCDMGLCTKAGRVAILHKNIPNMLTRFTAVFAEDNVNISDMLNRSRGEYAYTMLDVDSPITEEFVQDLEKIDGVIRIRVIK
jgi:D-3-phosphoglycerate dehydrogenase